MHNKAHTKNELTVNGWEQMNGSITSDFYNDDLQMNNLLHMYSKDNDERLEKKRKQMRKLVRKL